MRTAEEIVYQYRVWHSADIGPIGDWRWEVQSRRGDTVFPAINGVARSQESAVMDAERWIVSEKARHAAEWVTR